MKTKDEKMSFMKQWLFNRLLDILGISLLLLMAAMIIMAIAGKDIS